MDNTSTTAYWVAAAIILVLLVIGIGLWYSASTAPGIPNTGDRSGTIMDNSNMGSSANTDTSSSSMDGSGTNY